MEAIEFFKQGSVEPTESGLRCASWEIPPKLSYFEGHFPHLPVLPAVAIVDISLALIQAGRPEQQWRLLEVPSAKFHQPLAPGRRMNIIAESDENDLWHVEWFDAETSDVAAQLRLRVGR
jgi:3-hydroxymyristoyl/3-hydroxydecanoyl-(acyl carrier protein) dehydratase